MIWDKSTINLLRTPRSKDAFVSIDKKIIKSDSGEEYQIFKGIPVLLEETDKKEKDYAVHLFEEKAKIYDKYQHLSFETFGLNENDIRNKLIDKLNISAGFRVLELNAGTGRDSELILSRLDSTSSLHVQDISLDMLEVLKNKIGDSVFITQSNAEFLPYDDNLFDALYSFGGVGMNIYADTRKIMKEIVRVCKEGAKVVIGGLGIAPWLLDTEFARILINHNKHYSNIFDLKTIPIEARDVQYEWILNGAGFCLSFTVGVGEPFADFDYYIPGVRGGTLRTRYYGKLEGVSPETKALAYEAREKVGIPMYDFLNKAIQKYSMDIMGE